MALFLCTLAVWPLQNEPVDDDDDAADQRVGRVGVRRGELDAFGGPPPRQAAPNMGVAGGRQVGAQTSLGL